MFTALDTNLWRAYHNQLPFKMTNTTYSYATNDLLPPFGCIYISPPNSPISQCTNYKKNTQALLSISLKAKASLAVWYASNCGEQRGKKRPRDDKENHSTSFSRGMYFPTDYGRPMKPFFIEIQNFWAWPDKLGR